MRLAGVPLLLLAIARPEFLDARGTWARLPTNVNVQVQALTDSCAHDLVRGLLAGSPSLDREAVARRVEEAAGGNPLFIEELAAWLSEGATAGASGLPANLQAIIGARVDQLPAPEQQVILDASVVGDFFWLGSLRALGGNGSLVDTLQSLERRDLVRLSPSSRIAGDQEPAFKHGLIREVAYATLPKAVRRERHGVVARFIENAAGDPAAYAAILAHHWREAGDSVKAADYLLIAAQQAGHGWAHHEAVDLCNQALGLIPEGDETRRRRARLQRDMAAQAGWHASFDLATTDQSKSSGEMSPPIS
jgi:predicted ATPase